MTLVATSAKSSGSTASGITVIQDSVLGSAVASVSFAAIPQTYSSLRLVVSGRATAAVASEAVRVQFNADTGANYDYELLQAIGATAAGAETFADTSILLGYVPAASATAGVFSEFESVIPNYAGAVGQKSLHSSSALKRGTAAASNNMFSTLSAGFWRNTAAITSMLVFPQSTFVIGTRLTLYGLT